MVYAFSILIYYIGESDKIFIIMLAAVPLCFQGISTMQRNVINEIFLQSVGKTSLNHLTIVELDIYIKHIVENTDFFYEDYITKG
jgi:hypothetical protein